MSFSASSLVLAVLNIDIVGYSSIVGGDEEDAIRFVEENMEHVRRVLEGNGGTVRSKAGDSFLVTFVTLSDALRSAFTIQEEATNDNDSKPIRFRIGVHVGEVFISGEEVAGNAVNIAARLEALADPGGICVSRAVHDLAPAKLRQGFSRHGEVQLKNIDRPVEVFKTKHLGTPALLVVPAQGPQLLSDRPKILVRPFLSLDGEPRSACFAAGFTTDLISRLSRFRHLDVIGRASSYAVNAATINNSAAEEVHVRYIASGQFQILGTRMRAQVLLTDAESERVIWAETYDRDLDDVFAVQAEVVEIVTAGMAVNIDLEEGKIARARDPSSLDAYSHYITGSLEDLEDGAIGRIATARAIEFFTSATQDDPRYAAAIAGIARGHSIQWRFNWAGDRERSEHLATEHAVKAIEADPNDAAAYHGLGYVSLYRREHDRSLAAYEQALRLNPSDVEIIANYADSLKHSGAPEESVQHFERALKLNPLRPDLYLGNLGHAYMMMGDFERAVSTIRQMRQPLTAQRVLTASLMLAGREEEGKREAAILRSHVPDFTAKEWSEIVPDKLPEHSALFREGLERAGF